MYMFYFYSLHIKEKNLHQVQEEMRVLQLKVQEDKSKLQQLSDFMKRLQRKLLLVTKVSDLLLTLSPFPHIDAF